MKRLYDIDGNEYYTDALCARARIETIWYARQRNSILRCPLCEGEN